MLDRYPVPTFSLLGGIVVAIAVPFTAPVRMLFGEKKHFFNLRSEFPHFVDDMNMEEYKKSKKEVNEQAELWSKGGKTSLSLSMSKEEVEHAWNVLQDIKKHSPESEQATSITNELERVEVQLQHMRAETA